MLRLVDIDVQAVRELLGRHGLQLETVNENSPIPGSYWGEPEAGLIGTTVFARCDTPIHSLLHEACHLIVMPRERRATVHTNATDSVAEEDATCYLQIVLADALPGVGRDRLMTDMDDWGYTFRLGSAKAWFQDDAGDALEWLESNLLLPIAMEACANREWLPDISDLQTEPQPARTAARELPLGQINILFPRALSSDP
jgi:hypothetical protein